MLTSRSSKRSKKRWPPGHWSFTGMTPTEEEFLLLLLFEIETYFNLLLTGQSKIGRRRPISLDYHCVNISQWIFINKISLERSFHYLNADTLFLKIEQEMTPLQPFEVTQLIDLALDRSTSVKSSRNVYSKWRQGSKLSIGERTNFIAAPQTKNDWIFCFSFWKATSFTQDYVS